MVVKVKKKKTLAQKIAEKEEAAAKALEERMAREAEEKALNTPQGALNTTHNIGKIIPNSFKHYVLFHNTEIRK